MAVAQINVGFQVQVKELAEQLGQAAQELEKHKAKFTEVGNAIGQAGMYVGRYVDQMAGTVITTIGGVVTFIPEMISMIAKLNAVLIANPWILVTGAIVAGGAAIYMYTQRGTEAARMQRMLNDINKEALTSTAQQRAELDSLVKVAKDENLLKKDRLDAIQKLNQISPEYLGNITLETINTKKATDAIGSYIQALNSKARAQAIMAKKTELFQRQAELSMEDVGGKGIVQDFSNYVAGLLGIETSLINSREALERFIEKEKLSADQAKAIRSTYDQLFSKREKDLALIDKQINALDDYAKAEQGTGDVVAKYHENSEKAIGEKIKVLKDQRIVLDVNSEAYSVLTKQIKDYESQLKTSVAVTRKSKKEIVATEGTVYFYEQQIAALKEFQQKSSTSADEYGNAVERIKAYQAEIDKLTGKREKQTSLSMDIKPIQTGTIESYNQQIKALEKLRDTFPLASFAWKALDNQIKDIEFEVKVKVDEASIDGAAEGIKRLQQETETQAELATEMLYKKQEEAAMYADVVGGAFDQLSQNFIGSMGEAENGLERFGQAMAGVILKLISMALSNAMANAIVGATQSGNATGPGAVFATPAFIGTAIAGILGAFASIPKFADGGVVYGPVMGLMGEYAGAARNPEVIAPLNKLKDLIEPAGGGDTYVTLGGGFKISGSELQLILDRNQNRSKRIG